jgi:hypothetical protein
MTELYDEGWETYNELETLKGCLIQKAQEIPDLHISIDNPADVEQMAWLLRTVIDLYFSKIMLPFKFRGFIFSLVCLEQNHRKDEDGWFYVWDLDLDSLMSDEERRLPKRSTRLRDELERWQTDNGVEVLLFDRNYSEPVRDAQGEIIDIRYGMNSVDWGKLYRYKLNVLTDVLEILRKHRLDPKLLPGLTSMAMELNSKLTGQNTGLDSEGRTYPGKQRRRSFSSARSSIRKLIERARKDGDDPVVPIMELVKEVTSDIGPDDRVDMWLREQVNKQ